MPFQKHKICAAFVTPNRCYPQMAAIRVDVAPRQVRHKLKRPSYPTIGSEKTGYGDLVFAKGLGVR
jgi:hypothetical protein